MSDKYLPTIHNTAFKILNINIFKYFKSILLSSIDDDW